MWRSSTEHYCFIVCWTLSFQILAGCLWLSSGAFPCFLALSESHYTPDSEWPLNSIMVFHYTLALYGFLNSCTWLFFSIFNWEELDLYEYFRELGSCLLIQPFWLYLWILTMEPFWKHCLMAKEGLLPGALHRSHFPQSQGHPGPSERDCLNISL